MYQVEEKQPYEGWERACTGTFETEEQAITYAQKLQLKNKKVFYRVITVHWSNY